MFGENEEEEDLVEFGRFFVWNLFYISIEEDLEKFFVKYGFLFEFYYFIDSLIKKFKGFVFVIFMFFEYVVKVYLEVDG